ncbi:hypothetical protein NDU88_006185 [Pleurodeles waltl]|uniref:Uncharacterized protein n=1 Tax=Pleurodeles waltl TaxID=8319 RepID=A0AAV7N7Y3_PLEWA|nr:hypothetical protein NDU88_006185 [Pleurodeles waltl]
MLSLPTHADSASILENDMVSCSDVVEHACCRKLVYRRLPFAQWQRVWSHSPETVPGKERTGNHATLYYSVILKVELPTRYASCPSCSLLRRYKMHIFLAPEDVVNFTVQNATGGKQGVQT